MKKSPNSYGSSEQSFRSWGFAEYYWQITAIWNPNFELRAWPNFKLELCIINYFDMNSTNSNGI